MKNLLNALENLKIETRIDFSKVNVVALVKVIRGEKKEPSLIA